METFRECVDQYLQAEGQPSTAALMMVAELRRALLETAATQLDVDERVRLQNLAAVLPQW
jgi:Na+-translocating ferredoxin:NAD+ oxidoreductase RNF subunit RnfB